MEKTETNKIHIISIKIISIICLALFLAVAAAVHFNITIGIDKDLLLALRTKNNLSVPLFSSWLLPFMRFVTILGNTESVMVFTTLLLVYSIMKKKFKFAWIILLAVIGASLLDFLLKWGFDRNRPEVVPHLVQAYFYSFPSGHAFISAILYPLLAVFLIKITGNLKAKRIIISVTVLIVILIGFSRVYLGVHYPSDVIAGWLIGFAWASFCWILTEKITKYSLQKGY